MKNEKATEVVLSITKNASGKVLIISRNDPENYKDGTELKWVFPGGKPELNETLEEAVVREVKQETGFNTKVIKEISRRTHPNSGVSVIYFATELASLKVKPIRDVHEVNKVIWADISELKDYFTTDLDPGVAKYLGV